jgi:hypothetical protein
METESSSPRKALVTVQIDTFFLDRYQMPDVPLVTIEAFLEEHKGRKFPTSSFTLVNFHKAVLVIPTRLINSIRVDGEERWACPA